jgi:hypothetical protein
LVTSALSSTRDAEVALFRLRQASAAAIGEATIA